MKNEHRTEARESIRLALQTFDGVKAVTRDISASGLFFETETEQRIGGLIDFEIDLATPAGPIKFRAQGEIVRLESNAGKTGVGVKLLSSRLEVMG